MNTIKKYFYKIMKNKDEIDENRPSTSQDNEENANSSATDANLNPKDSPSSTTNRINDELAESSENGSIYGIVANATNDMNMSIDKINVNAVNNRDSCSIYITNNDIFCYCTIS